MSGSSRQRLPDYPDPGETNDIKVKRTIATAQQSSPPSPAIRSDDEKPCCSKSLARNSPQHVVFQICNDKQDHPVKPEVSFSEPPILPLHPLRSIGRGLALSDTVLAKSNLPEFERAHNYDDDELKYSFDVLKDEASARNANDIPINERRPPNPIPNLLCNVPDDGIPTWKFPNSNYLWENAGFHEGNSKNIQSSVSFNNNTEKGHSDSTAKLLEHASYLFDKDRVEQVNRTLNLFPRGREFVVFNIFTDVARVFGFGRRRRMHVQFPAEVLQEYEQKGDVAGKDRFVPSTKQPYRGVTATSKKRRLSAVYSQWTVKETQFVPKVDRIDDVSRLEHFCERKCVHCDCCDCCRSDKKPDLGNVMEGFFSDLNLASFFLHSHSTRTFDSALATLEFVQMHAFSMTTINTKSAKGLNYSQHYVGTLTGSIWIFGYCVRTMMELAGKESGDPSISAKLCSESGFRKAMEQFAAICLSISESIKIVIEYSHNFYNFCKECVRILKVLRMNAEFKAEFTLKKPFRRGSGLTLNREMKRKDIVKQNAVIVLVAKTKADEESDEVGLDWEPFEELSGNEKIYYLRHLLHVTGDGITLVQTQLRFLLDDIVDSVKDIAEADLLFLLADMFDRIKYLGNVGKKKTKKEMEQIAILLADFCKDFQSFIDFGQHIIKRFVEFRDMVHITHDYFVHGLKLDLLSEMLPPDIFKKKRKPWCGGPNVRRSKKKIIDKFFPKYKVEDFFRVYYKEAVHAQIYANKCHFTVGWCTDTIKEIIPTSNFQGKWGEPDLTSPRLSYEEYVDSEDIDDEALEIKPILIPTGYEPPPITSTEEEATATVQDTEAAPAKIPVPPPTAEPIKGALVTSKGKPKKEGKKEGGVAFKAEGESGDRPK